MFKSYPDVVDVHGLCQMLHISKRSAYELLHKNQINHVKIGRIYRIRKESIIEFMASTDSDNTERA